MSRPLACAYTSAPSREQLVEGQAGHLAQDVPQGHVHRGDGAHRDRAAAPVRPAMQELPRILDAPRVAADEVGHHVFGEISGHGEFTAVQRGIAQAGQPGACGDLQRDEVASPFQQQ